MSHEVVSGVGHKTIIRILKWEEDAYLRGDDPHEEFVHEGNIVTTSGAAAMWSLLMGDGLITNFSNSNARVGVGDSSTAAAAAQTDLQASTNKLRKACLAGSPGRTNNAITFMTTFTAAEANFDWNEMGVFNAQSGGTMLNRGTFTGGTKPSNQVWAAIMTITLV